MSTTYRFGVRAFGCNILVETSYHEAHAVLERYVFPSLPRMNSAGGPHDLRLRIIAVADRFEMLVDDAAVASASQAIDLVPDLIRALDEAVVQHLTHLRAVHAGAVMLNGRALLLPGPTHAGKSSLIAELLRRGATYFSDEYALIDAYGRVHPYPRPLLLRNGGPEKLPVLPEEYSASVGHASVPVGWIISLKYVPGCVWNLTRVTQSETLLTLLRNTPHNLEESTDMIGVFQRAVAGAACYVGQRPEAAHVVNEILKLVENS